MTDSLATYDRIPDNLVESIAKGGRSYQHEARNMARELLRLRVSKQHEETAKTLGVSPVWNPYGVPVP